MVAPAAMTRVMVVVTLVQLNSNVKAGILVKRYGSMKVNQFHALKAKPDAGFSFIFRKTIEEANLPLYTDPEDRAIYIATLHPKWGSLAGVLNQFPAFPSPRLLDQLIGRTWRIGQRKTPLFLILTTIDTYDQVLQGRFARKTIIQNSILANLDLDDDEDLDEPEDGMDPGAEKDAKSARLIKDATKTSAQAFGFRSDRHLWIELELGNVDVGLDTRRKKNPQQRPPQTRSWTTAAKEAPLVFAPECSS
ncbi:uncharacterized protein J3D65DRAFT_657788 [Phyllosticta citribraziliensis]|uniref:Uncharacterized protein n=1 Tax=Phyllosticta citribraziliensis TaxID=989973 RepID=A0ABR1LUT0_9PEZI